MNWHFGPALVTCRPWFEGVRMSAEKLKALQIDPSKKRRPQGMIWLIFIVVVVVTLAVLEAFLGLCGKTSRM